jgi:hypothetical protein
MVARRSIFAYGQTGSGKTFTMMGSEGNLRGLIPRISEALFTATSQIPVRSDAVSSQGIRSEKHCPSVPRKKRKASWGVSKYGISSR